MAEDRRTPGSGSGDRRGGTDRRRSTGGRGFLLRLLKGERRQLDDRRRGGDGRAGTDRRTAGQTATDLVRGAFDLVATVCASPDSHLDDEARQRLDSALVRLKFALERLTSGPSR
jgi:hypothetical protein